jgi:TM2 domain-containing membrane protein YozV
MNNGKASTGKKVIGVILSVFLGGFGFHHAYLGSYKLAFVYGLFGWTGIPVILGLIEAFFMPRRVDEKEKNGVQIDYVKFIIAPLLGVAIPYTIGTAFLHFAPQEMLEPVKVGESQPSTLVGKIHQEIDRAEEIIEKDKTRQKIKKQMTVFLKQPAKLYNSKSINEKLKEFISQREFEELSNSFSESDKLRRGYVSYTNPAESPLKEKFNLRKIYSIIWHLTKRNKEREVQFTFFETETGEVYLGQLAIDGEYIPSRRELVDD